MTIEIMNSQSSTSDEKLGDYCYEDCDYSTTTTNITGYYMSGSGENSNYMYMIDWNDDGTQNLVWIHNSTGKHLKQGKLWVDDDYRLVLSYKSPKIGEWTQLVNYDDGDEEETESIYTLEEPPPAVR
jgi:hypothetical protein